MLSSMPSVNDRGHFCFWHSASGQRCLLLAPGWKALWFPLRSAASQSRSADKQSARGRSRWQRMQPQNHPFTPPFHRVTSLSSLWDCGVHDCLNAS
jgi:hypothetical protein